MHELSIARSLVRVAEDAAQEAGAAKVTALYLRLGVLAGVVRESLEFAYDFATDGTLLDGSKLVIEPVDLLCHCDACDREVRPASTTKIRCPHCDAPTPNVVEGREIVVRAIDYDEVGAVPTPS
ncbi:MAG: hydrogenase maturation nickel metallochaperone HypA [Planctomycetota bacterium]